jgi:hypothetical protein
MPATDAGDLLEQAVDCIDTVVQYLAQFLRMLLVTTD